MPQRQPQAETTVVNCRKEPYDVFIGRPSIWGNPFLLGWAGDRETVIAMYRRWIVQQPHLMARLHELRGKRLGCFCKPDKACHGDVLVELINLLPREHHGSDHADEDRR